MEVDSEVLKNFVLCPVVTFKRQIIWILVGKLSYWLYSLMAQRPPYLYSEQEVTRRIRALRHLFVGSGHGKQTLFAQRAHIDSAVWNNFERGSPVPRDAAIKLIYAANERGMSLTTDWIWFGRTDGLLPSVVEQLQQAQREVDEYDLAVANQVRLYLGSGKKKSRTKTRA